jgi:hypothetical protein
VSDDQLPYEKAIEETAKATGKVVDLVRDGVKAVSPAIADAYGFLIGDRMTAARKRNLDAIGQETERILRDRDIRTGLPRQSTSLFPSLRQPKVKQGTS